ncbi:hypothetical protein DVS28_b0572 (plasmid) [Euzebya pacifica]|uniref:Pentapeptide repeat-containing protein n=1 Tax=Euzebya pacifica TaxID=1608957 RepID=A0A346Y765_9ACTN|nr:pentapeptide repeat-containing protein [Euzebya pacifica]AXV10312.1 hypothetical protein DVS28_b0572 [Euzebya pacifica]
MSNSQTCGARTADGRRCGHPISGASKCAAGHPTKAALPDTHVPSTTSLGADPFGTAGSGPSAVGQAIGEGLVSGRHDNASFAGEDLSAVAFHDEPEFHRCDFSGAVLKGGRLDGVFTHCDFTALNANRAAVGGLHVASDFTDADLAESRVPSMHGGSLDGANMRHTIGMRTSVHRVDFGTADLHGSGWTASQFHGADLSNVRNIDTARFDGCTYDDDTRFPAGYDPTANGWTHAPDRTGRLAEAWAQIESDAANGNYTPWVRYPAA